MKLRQTFRLLGPLFAAAMLALLAAGPASAELTRPNTFSFGKDGTGGTAFIQPAGIAFHQASKRLYVTNGYEPPGIYGFDASTPGTYTPLAAFNPLETGSPSNYPGFGVDNTGAAGHDGNLYLSSEFINKLFGFDSTGAALAGFNGLEGIDPAANPGAPSGGPSKDLCGGTVDPFGNVWIGNYSTEYIIKYDFAGNYLESISTAGIGGGHACQMAFDSNGDLYAVMYNESVWKLAAPGYTAATKIEPIPGGPEYPRSIGVNRTTHHVFVSHYNVVAEYESDGTLVQEFGKGIPNFEPTGIDVNEATDEVYVADANNAGGKVRVFGPPGLVPDVTTGGSSGITRTTADVVGHVELAGGTNITECSVEYGTEGGFGGQFSYSGSAPCSNALPITSGQDVSVHITGLKSQTKYHYRIKAGNSSVGPNYGADATFTTQDSVKDLQTLDATDVGLESATLNGSFDRDGYTTNYYFQYTYQLNQFTEEPEFNSFEQTAVEPGPVAGSDTVSVTLPGGLEHGKTYHYRLIATNNFGTTVGAVKTFYPSAKPTLLENMVFVSEVSTDQGTIHLTANPNGLLTTYHIEYGTEGDCASNPCISLPATEIVLGAAVFDATNTFQLTGLEPDTVYHYRVVLTNSKGTVTDVVDHRFKTFAHNVVPSGCPNSLARQQTGAALLLDCRAFELVSAADTGGYDVESSLAPGQQPYGGYPHASAPSQVLYGIHNGAIPGVGGNPTNKGIDPYVATRGDGGWTTKYVGISANGTPSIAPFASTLLAADPGLDTFAFGGPGLCAPCFDNGATGIPMRLPDGSLVQGMAGQSDPGAAAVHDGLVSKAFSGDGSHFVFGSLLPYQPDGNNNTGDVSIYDRNLKTGVTQVVSKSPAGTNLTCLGGVGTCHSPAGTDGIAELDISKDGSRIVVGQLVSQDAAGNDYFHLYMHTGTSPNTVDLTPGTTTGAHFDGMTADGSAVYFTTRDPLDTSADQDTDTSVDLFRAAIAAGGGMTLTRISTGTGAGNGSGNFDGCDPTGDSTSPEDWNTAPGGPTDCSVLAVGGGGGVAAGDGTIYFLSPEKLDGDGEDGTPNLFIARPGSAPAFVATLASNANFPFPAEKHLVDYEINGFAIPSGAAIDHGTGGYYVLDNAWRYPNFEENEDHSFVQKFDSSGHLDQSFGTAGKIDGSKSPTGYFRELGKIGGNAWWAAPDSIAVDNTCVDRNLTGNACTTFDPSNGDLYVPDRGNNVVDKFDSNGNYISQIDVTEVLGTVNVLVNGVEVDSATGRVFVETTGGIEGGGVLIYDNSANNVYTGEKFATNTMGNSADMAIDSAGNVYLTTTYFSPSLFVRKYAPPYSEEFTTFGGVNVSGLAYDPISDHLFLDKGDHIEEYTTGGVQVGPSFGSETLIESYGLDAYDNRLVVSNKGPTHVEGKFTVFTERRIPPDPRYDSSMVVNSVNDGNTRHTEDLQIAPRGDDAVFGSAVALTDYDPGAHSELYRFDAPGDELECISCPSSNAAATGDATLAPQGLNLTEDGRVFFTATEPLVLRDTNGKEDVYEWNDGEVQPISPGSDQFGSRLLTVSADGTDVYFFTHATLAPQDRSGGQAKIYDARENGGFFVVPAQPPCAASDECHGPGTKAASSPDIGSFGGTPTGVTPAPACRKGKVRRNGRCVKPPHKKRHHRKHRDKRQATGKRG